MLFASCENNERTASEIIAETDQKTLKSEGLTLNNTIDSIQTLQTAKINHNKSLAEKKAIIKQQPVQPNLDSNQAKKERGNIATNEEPDSGNLKTDIGESFQVIKTKYDHVPFYMDFEDDDFFVVVNGKWDRHSLNRISEGNHFKMGLVNASGHEVLPLNFSAIHNPGIFDIHWLEVEKNNKSGLYNIATGMLIEPEFDLLLPSGNEDQLAIAKTGNDYFMIGKDGSSSEITDKKLIPEFFGLKKGILFRTSLPDIKQMRLTRMIEKNNAHLKEGSGVVFTPLYIKKLNVMYDSFQGITSTLNRQEMEFGTVGGISQIAKIVDISPDVKAFYVKFHTSGVDVEEYNIDKEKVITIGRNNVVLDSKTLLSSFNNEKPFCSHSSYKLLDQSLIEVKKYAQPADYYRDYAKMPIYAYKKIKENGTVETLNSVRFFDFTQFVKIDTTYLIDCLLKNNDPESPDYVDGNYNLLMTKHYDQEDLYVMIQEIYASYGQIFSDEKWASYFSGKDWYIPTYDDVTNQLTTTDQHNISVIKKVIDKMEGNEADFLKKDALIYAETEF